jgi:hypothetical protein
VNDTTKKIFLEKVEKICFSSEDEEKIKIKKTQSLLMKETVIEWLSSSEKYGDSSDILCLMDSLK